MRIFVGSLSLAYFLLNFLPFVGIIMFRRHPPFLHSSPSHNFFRNFFAKSFVDSIIIVTFAVSYPCWKPSMGKGGGHIYIKGVTVRFGFDAIRTSQLPKVCQEQSNGDAPWDVSYIQPLLAHSI